MINFLIDSRYGGPQMIHDHLKKKYLKNIKTIYFDKKNKNLNFYNFKKKFRFLFLVDVILNLLILLKNKKNLSAHNFFFVYSIVNIVPVIFGILEKKKIIWYILEKPNLIFYIIFKILNYFGEIEVICITESLAKILRIKKYQVYFPTISLKYWKRRNSINKKIINGKFQRILCVGNFNQIKNHIQLLKYLEHSKLKYKLSIIGKKLSSQKKYFLELNHLINEINSKNFNKITIHQNKKKEFVKKKLNNVDIFILPSLKEGLSIALVEAMCMKTLCLVSKPSNHSNLIINNKNGYVFELNQESFLSTLSKIYKLKKKEKNKIVMNAQFSAKKLIKKNVVFEKKIINMLLSNHQ